MLNLHPSSACLRAGWIAGGTSAGISLHMLRSAHLPEGYGFEFAIRMDGIRWERPGVWPGSNGRARWTEFWWFWILNRCDRWKMVVLSQYQYQYHYISLLLIIIVYYYYYYFYHHHHHHHHDRWMDNRMYLRTVSAFRLDRGSSLASRVATALRQRCGHPRPAVAVGVSRHGGIPQMDGL